MANLGGNAVTEITRAEHIGPDDTGDNINAKRVAPYVFDSRTLNWLRTPSPYIPYAYDYIAANLSGSTSDIYTFYQGGSGGTLVATVTITYTDSTKGVLQSVART